MKRFTESNKWSDGWYRRLALKHKLLWIWLCDNCDAAGVIEPDMELAGFQIGEAVGIEDMDVFERQITKINGSKFWIVKFIPFQYGTLTEVCRAHLPVIRLVEKHGILDRVSIPYTMAMDSHKEKEKEKEQDRGVKRGAKDVLPTTPEAVAIANLFSRRLTTAWSQKEVEAFGGATKRGIVTLDNISLVAAYYAAERLKGDQGRHRRDLSTFLNNFDGEVDRARAFTAPKPKAMKEELKGLKFV